MTASADGVELRRLIKGLSAEEIERLARDWLIWARDDQLPPETDWKTWLILGGRGAGKTRTGAEWVRGMVAGMPPFANRPAGRIALIGETFDDARAVMVEGVSGLLGIYPDVERPVFEPSLKRLSWRNGATARIFSAEDPDALRGPQFDAAWADELAKWRHADATWDMLQFALRLGDRPRQIVTTTPRPIPLIRRLMADAKTALTRCRTDDNRAFLADGFHDHVMERYGGSRLGRQELDGELIEDRDDALWSRAAIDRLRVREHPPLNRILVAVDPPATSGPKADACGIIIAGRDAEGMAYVLEDGSVANAAPHVWAERAVGLWRRYEADGLIAEVNQGGEMVAAVIGQVDPAVPVQTVRATRGKWTRAEPVATLYARGRVRHVGAFPELEDELCDFGANGLSSGRSPDRLDALVWALTALMLDGSAEPRVHVL